MDYDRSYLIARNNASELARTAARYIDDGELGDAEERLARALEWTSAARSALDCIEQEVDARADEALAESLEG